MAERTFRTTRIVIDEPLWVRILVVCLQTIAVTTTILILIFSLGIQVGNRKLLDQQKEDSQLIKTVVCNIQQYRQIPSCVEFNKEVTR